MEPRFRTFRYFPTPCYYLRWLDILIHRLCPRTIRFIGWLLEATPPIWDEWLAYWLAARLERTSPRWGWRATSQDLTVRRDWELK